MEVKIVHKKGDTRGPKSREEKKLNMDSISVLVEDEKYDLKFGVPYFCNGYEFIILYAYTGKYGTTWLMTSHQTINNVWAEESVLPNNLFNHFKSKLGTRNRGSRFSKLNGLKYIKKKMGKNPVDITKDDLTFDKFIQVGTEEFNENFELSLAYKVLEKMK